MKYRVEPGLYKIGDPAPNDPVFVSANYRLSFNHLRHALAGRNAWILVLDTKGINVWCAAGKGTFGTLELVGRIGSTGLEKAVNHKSIIVPQLGASGVAAHEVKKQTGFTVHFGPVYAKDLPEYLDNSNKASPAMRRSRFNLADRITLVPMEVVPALKELVVFLLTVAIVSGLAPEGILFAQAWHFSQPVLIATLVALSCGSIAVPVLLPWIPGRAFAVKGLVTGLIGFAALAALGELHGVNRFIFAFCGVALPAYSSFRAFNFTGSTTFTNPSGVKKELRFAWPFYLVAAGIAAVLLVLALLRQRGIV
jgi:acetyl-CoA decarbonylase/synthase complex subunit gamma